MPLPLTLLQIIQACQAELGLPLSMSVVGNPDQTTTQMFYLANRCLDELRRMNPTGWAALQNEYNLVVSTPIITTGNTTLNSPVITNIAAGTSSLAADYWQVSANSTPIASRILSVDSATQVTMTMNATGTSTGQGMTFSKDTYAFPGDYDWTQNRTHWDRTNRWELLGPDSPQLDQWHRSGIVATGPRRHFRRLGQLPNKFRIWPAPAEIANPLQLVFEYMSINSVQTSSSSTCSFTGSISGTTLTVPSNPTTGNLGVGQVLTGGGVAAGTIISNLMTGNGLQGTYEVNQSQVVGSSAMVATGASFSQYFENDTDMPLLDDQAITTGVKWLFWETKGFNVSSQQGRWVDYVERLIARDETAATLGLVKRMNPIFLSQNNIQDGFFPGPVGPSNP